MGTLHSLLCCLTIDTFDLDTELDSEAEASFTILAEAEPLPVTAVFAWSLLWRRTSPRALSKQAA